MKFDGERNRAENLLAAIERGEPAEFMEILAHGAPWRPSALADLIDAVGAAAGGGALGEQECVECLAALFAAGARPEAESLAAASRWACGAARELLRDELGPAALGSFAVLAALAGAQLRPEARPAGPGLSA